MNLRDWKNWTKELKRELYALYLASRDPRVPRRARWLAIGVVAYAFSPFDLIPDFIPVIGYLDDLIIVPLGIALVLRMIPPDVMTDCRSRAKEIAEKPVNWVAGGFMIAIWLAVLAWVGIAIFRMIHR